MSMFTDPSSPHQEFPLLKAKAKETEWLCRALTSVWPQFNDEASQCRSRVLALLLVMSLLQEVLCSMHQKTLTRALNMHCLFKWAETTGARRWSAVLKHHYTGQLAQQAHWLHI